MAGVDVLFSPLIRALWYFVAVHREGMVLVVECVVGEEGSE